MTWTKSTLETLKYTKRELHRSAQIFNDLPSSNFVLVLYTLTVPRSSCADKRKANGYAGFIIALLI